MRKCEKCGRILKLGETNLCPACEAKSDHSKKDIVIKATGGSFLLGLAGLLFKIVKGKITGNLS